MDSEQRETDLLELLATEQDNPWQWYLITFSDSSGLQGAVLIEGLEQLMYFYDVVSLVLTQEKQL